MSDHIHINVLAANGTDWRRRVPAVPRVGDHMSIRTEDGQKILAVGVVSAVLWQLRQDKDGAAITISLKDEQV